MKFSIRLTDSAVDDIEYFRKDQQVLISDGISQFLAYDANVETRRRKPLRPNFLAKWELRLDEFRVFYDIDLPDMVTVTAVGRKEHNDLYIRGKKVDI